MTTLVNSFRPGGGVSGTATHALGFTPTVGNTLVMWLHMTASVNTLTSATLGSGRGFTVHDDVVDTTYSERMYCLSRVVQSGDASSVTLVSSAGNVFFHVLEVSGLLTPEATGFEGPATAVHATPAALSHSKTFASANSNDFVLVGMRAGATINPFTGVSSGYTYLTNGRSGSDAFYNLDLGASGTETFAFTLNASTDPRLHFYVFKAAATDPIVSTVTGTTVTEGGNIVFTVTLSGPTNRSTTYPASFGGTATSADYNNALGSATYSDGVTAGGSDIVVPSGVSSFTITIATTQDALDEDNETLVLRVGGVDSTGGSITDDDAAPTISVSDATENAGEVIFTVSLSAASGKSITVDYVTADGTSTAGVDYTAKTGTLTFAAGETTKTVTVTVP